MRARLSLLSLALVAACSSGGDGDTQSLESTPTPTTAAPSSATTTAPPATSNTTAPLPGASSRATAGTTTGSSTGGTVSKPLATTAPGKPAAAKATRAGTYTLDAQGTVTLGNPGTPQDVRSESTLTVSPLKDGVQHSTLHSEETGDTEQDIVVRDTGSYAASLKLSSQAFTKEFLPDPPFLLMPDPAVVGKTWAWSATSTDGKTKADATNKLVRNETLTIGGTKVATVVLQTHLVLSGDVDFTADITLWWAPDSRLPVKERTVGKGSYNGFPFSTDITATMRSTTPA